MEIWDYLRAEKVKFQAQEVYEQELAVASRLEVNFLLRPLYDVWSTETDRFTHTAKQRLVHFYAADVQRLDSATVEPVDGSATSLNTSRSYVIDGRLLDSLPLAGRDAYALLVAMPGVTADNATARGLGFSVNGQRPSASNFLLDGLENNNELVTGNLTPIAPEALEEYRISISNFSAEYGRTSGFLANAITRAGGTAWHGLAYIYGRNDVLNANGFRQRIERLPNLKLERVPLKELQPGYRIGGPLAKGLFGSMALEYLRSRSFQDPGIVRLPSAAFVASTPPDSYARRLTASLDAPRAAPGQSSAEVLLSPASSRDRLLVTPRIDRVFRNGRERVMARAAVSRLEVGDFVWTPYRDFASPLRQNATSTAVTLTSSKSTGLTNELRAGWSLDSLRFERARPEVPLLISFDFDQPGAETKTLMPGSPIPYGFRNRNRTWQLIDNLAWTKARHVPKIGGGLIWRRVAGSLSFFSSGQFGFGTLDDFRENRANLIYVPLSRKDLGRNQLPDYDRRYNYFQFFAFAQDSFKVTRRLALDYGIRYENFGAPANTGRNKDLLIALGQGVNLQKSIEGATLAQAPEGSQRLYDRDNNNVTARAGLALTVSEGTRPLVLRGSYGIFYDRPFDNLWLNLSNNNFVLGTSGLDRRAPTDYLAPLSGFLGLRTLRPQSDFPRLSVFQPGFRAAYVQSYFLGVERPFTENLTLEAHVAGSLGRKLITTDIVNRDFSLKPEEATEDNLSLRYEPKLPPLDYRSNQGGSSYHALTLVGRYRARTAQLQMSYSWSHAIDNQTEALGGDFFNLGFTNLVQGGGVGLSPAQFTRQFDSRVDRGNSDFDQRHNLVLFSYWDLPAVFGSSKAGRWLRNWRLAALAAFRSGFPFTVNVPFAAPRPGDPILVNRANLSLTEAGAYTREEVNGGVRLLNPRVFQTPVGGLLGNTGRNAFRGPGLMSLDLSLGRSLALKWLGDSGRLAIRADAFNVLNHANLNNPNPVFEPGDSQFGVALYGRRGQRSGFPGAIPLDETARQIQLSLRIEF